MRSILTALQEGRLFELPDATKDRALEFLARILDANPDIEVGTDAIEEVKLREQQCNTAIGLGVAVPHVRVRREEGELFCAIGWSAQGIAYGAEDGGAVHLVFMYYIPGSQKNVYLKEISSLAKAVRLSGGIQPIAHASELNAVRNLLLDWVGRVLQDSGPDAVARMIKLEVKQAQAPVMTAPVGQLIAPVLAPAGLVGSGSPTLVPARAMSFAVLVLAGQPACVLAQEPEWVAALEKDPALARKLASSEPMSAAGRRVFVTGATVYAGGRTLYQCVAISVNT